ncbi:hypothetical protein GCM10027047_26730 [Rhodococcus aerolatus]
MTVAPDCTHPSGSGAAAAAAGTRAIPASTTAAVADRAVRRRARSTGDLSVVGFETRCRAPDDAGPVTWRPRLIISGSRWRGR